MAHRRQSRPDAGLDMQVKVFETFQVLNLCKLPLGTYAVQIWSRNTPKSRGNETCVVYLAVRAFMRPSSGVTLNVARPDMNNYATSGVMLY